MTYRALAARAGYSYSVLAAAASGSALPTLPVTLAYVGACKGDQAAWQMRWEELAKVLRATHPGLLAPDTAGALSEQTQDGPQSSMQPASAPDARLGPPVPAAPAPLQPLGRHDPRRVEGFRVLGRLGVGAMGEVFLAVGPKGRPVALKLIRAELARDPLFRRRFAAELSAASRVTGTRCPVVVGADAEAQRPWMATEFVAAPTLGEIVDRFGPLPGPALFTLAKGVAEALESIHGAGVVHRDLKPSNVLWDGEGPKVIDFGVCRAADATALTATGHPVGTAGYTAPEQAERGDTRPAGDVFALGCVLAYAATGIPAFGDGPGHEILYRVIHQDPAPEALACQDGQLRELIIACLGKDPAVRPTPRQIIEACDVGAGSRVPASLAGAIDERGRQAARLLSQARAARRARIGATVLAPTAVAVLLTLFLLPGSAAPRALVAPGSTLTSAGTPRFATGPGADSSPSIHATASSATAHADATTSPSTVFPGGSSGNSLRPTGAVPTGAQGGGTQAAAPSALSGPACGSGSNKELSLYKAPDGDGWHNVTDASAPNGCGTPMYTALSGKTNGQWQDDGDWVFHPGAGTSCTVQVHIPNSSKAAATAHYWIYDADATTGAHGNDLLEDVPVDQSAKRGAWVPLGTVTTTTGTLDVSIVDNGAGSADIAADNAELFCT